MNDFDLDKIDTTNDKAWAALQAQNVTLPDDPELDIRVATAVKEQHFENWRRYYQATADATETRDKLRDSAKAAYWTACRKAAALASSLVKNAYWEAMEGNSASAEPIAGLSEATAATLDSALTQFTGCNAAAWKTYRSALVDAEAIRDAETERIHGAPWVAITREDGASL